MNILSALESGNAHHQAGRLGQAEAIYRQILAMDPSQPDALHLLGLIASQAGHDDQAVELIQRAIAISPDFADYHNNLGTILHRNKKLDQAMACFERAVMLRPDSSDFASNLGSAMLDSGRPADALEILRQAVANGPSSLGAIYNLANALKMTDQPDEAIECYQRALALNPQHLESINNLGNTLKNSGRLDEAIQCFRRALALNPDFFVGYNNLGDAFYRKGNLREAENCFRRALAIRPDVPKTHWNLGNILLLQGYFDVGWPEFAWRSRVDEFNFIRKEFSRPQWNGDNLYGGTILLHTEQGFGDNIQFVRYLPMVKMHGGRIILGCERELFPLLGDQVDVDGWLFPGEPMPEYEVHCPLLDLPMVLGTTLETIPARVPYLYANPDLQTAWGERLAEIEGLRVGLAWAGRPTHFNDRNRSMPLSAFAPLAEIPGISLISLQKGEASRQSPGSLKLIDWTEELTDFAQTAALIANLDLVISVDTSLVHLAGAMGKPVWVLLPFAPDWRWLMERTDSPWYPTMRLFRQARPGDWSRPIGEIVESLQAVLDAQS